MGIYSLLIFDFNGHNACLGVPALNEIFFSDTITQDTITLTHDSILTPIKDTKKTELAHFDFKHVKKHSKNPFSTPFMMNGNVTLESFGTNAQNPIAMNEKLYTRIWFNPSLTLFGLPFSSDFYYTTESNSYYNSNSFNITFDFHTFKRQLMEGVYRELNERRKVDNMRERDINTNVKQREELENKRNLINRTIDSFENELQSIEPPNGYHDTSLQTDLPNEDGTIYKDSIQYDTDSLEAVLKNKKRTLEKLKKDKDILEDKIMKLSEKKAALEKLRQSDSALINMDERELQSKANLKNIAGAYNSKYNKLLKFATCIEKFNIGTVYPVHSDLTVMGTSVRGIDLQWANDKSFIKLSTGKAVANDFRFFGNHRPDFDRNFYAITAGLGNEDQNHIYVSRVYFNDPEKITDRQRVTNSIQGIGGQLVLFNDHLTMKGELMHSQYFSHNSSPSKNVEIEGLGDSFTFVKPTYSSLHSAYHLQSIYKLGKNTDFEGSIQRVAPGFKTLGNPFLRTGFLEKGLAFNTKLFKEKVSAGLFYKTNQDNLAQENTATNTMNGYGISLQTHLNSRYPNFSFLHSPYQHGNNHPDSILRSFNQFSITNLTASYSKKVNRSFWVLVFSFSQSVISLDQLGQTGMRSTVFNNSVSLPKEVQLNFLWQNNSTNPGVDTLNANLFSFAVNKQMNPKFNLGSEGHITHFKNGAYKNGGKLMISYKLRSNFNLSFMGGYDAIHKLWGFENKNVLSFRIRTYWRW